MQRLTDQNSYFKKLTWLRLLKTIKLILITLGFFSLIMLVLAFTSLPYCANNWLGTYKSKCACVPEYVVMFGGSGMPSENNLIRLYYTAAIANNYPSCIIIMAHPIDSSVYAEMINELTKKGIDTSRIFFEKQGTNTRSQVLFLEKDFPQLKSSNVIIVTSPEHILRTVLTYKKLGFKKCCGYPAFGSDMNIDLSFNSKKIGGSKFIPDIGGNLSFRYNFWNYLKLEITCLREYTALFYYWLNNWI